MKKRVCKVVSIILSLSLSLLCFGCGDNSSKKKGSSGGSGKTVNICMSSWVGYGPLYVAKEKGIFEKNGVNVNIQVIESVTDINSSLASGSSDGCVVATGTYIIGKAAGVDQEQVMVLDDSYGGDGVVTSNDINSFTDLKGKRVGVSLTGDTSTLLFFYLLKEYGMSQDDVEISNLSPGDAGSAFVGGKISAAVTYEPWLTSAKKTGKVLVSSKDTPGLINDVLCFKKEFIKENPDEVQAIVDSWFEALDYVEKNQEECNKIMAESQGMTVEDFEACLPTVKFYDREMNKEYFSSKKINEVTNETADIWYQLKLINNKDLDLDNSIEDKFINK